jgi:hypothetical protein
MKRVVILCLLVLAGIGLTPLDVGAADPFDWWDAQFGPDRRNDRTARTSLDGYQAVPALVSPGVGAFKARLSPDGQSIEYVLFFTALAGDVTQAHIHFGRRGTNGGVQAFLCSNFGSPVPTQPCPAQGGWVTGTLTAADVVGPTAQGASAGDITNLVRSMFGSEPEAAYVCVHSVRFPGGEIRGDLQGRGR